MHVAAGFAAIGLNAWAFVHEHRALLENRALVDRAAAELDRLDRASAGSAPEVAVDYDPARIGRWGVIVAVSAWFPYLYWALIVWRGDFSRVSVHPWIEGSALGLGVWWLARRESRSTT